MNRLSDQYINPYKMREGSLLRAGVVGLGMIGGGVAVSMVKRGRIPAVFDIRPDAADGLVGVPRPLASPAEVAKVSNVVMVAVVNDVQAFEAICGPEGLLKGPHCNLIIVLLSTIAVSVVHKLSEQCAKANVGFLDCGVTPGNKAADNGMVAIVGGEEVMVERARPVLEDWAKKVVHCGPQGTGMATKIARNLVTFGSWRTVAEASMLAGAAGVKPGILTEIIEAADPKGETLLHLLKHRDKSGTLPEKLTQVIEPLMTKDLEAAQELSAMLGVKMPLLDVTRTHGHETLGLKKDPRPLPEDRRERGKEMMVRVYGREVSQAATTGLPFIEETINHLFAGIWSRPGLSIRDRRLLVMGVTATLGRADLMQVQMEGALANKELTVEQLQEVILHLAYYVGWGNATAVQQAATAAIQSFTVKEKGEAECQSPSGK
jgi:3-hydroxyisobutyrate dehydrogenase-like beta-hydroxyacid dehydrogenase